MKVEIEWIACSDRLPDDEETVLVVTEGETWMGFHEPYGWFATDATPLADVTHWATMPEMP